jgi:hypothetical protein
VYSTKGRNQLPAMPSMLVKMNCQNHEDTKMNCQNHEDTKKYMERAYDDGT